MEEIIAGDDQRANIMLSVHLVIQLWGVVSERGLVNNPRGVQDVKEKLRRDF